MKPKFEILFLEGAIDFLEKLDSKSRSKLIYNIDKSRYSNDPRLFKKLNDKIWEFRTRYQGQQIRLFAFWDNTKINKTLVISTHGIIKKSDKIPLKELIKVEVIRVEYLKHKK